MKVVYTPAHLKHDPHLELEGSNAHSPFEHIGRAENIREVLSADPAYQFLAPTEWGTAPITAVHDPGLMRFLEVGWNDYQQVRPGTREVVAWCPGGRHRPYAARSPSSTNCVVVSAVSTAPRAAS